MNLDSLPRPETIHVTAPGATTVRPPQTMPQRSPFAIQELLGLSDSSRPSGVVSAVTPSLYPGMGQSPFSSDSHQMQMASRMAYFNAHAAVAAAFLPHNMAASAAGGPLQLHHQTSGGQTTHQTNPAPEESLSVVGGWKVVSTNLGVVNCENPNVHN
ncbi:conserved hypothetical protein [Culex quinquefasciatus]|uniref:Uncharacterized protein n=1 Tax=Culex quinquefasciatus TaxID=7176 RepID=B0X183_CULQU|nr:conserved hypothetical protein [Culex quinquefasciatus]|eukprot:XP_001863405.1 conserved hypothetical protein [Culex quinquefasciatus]